MPFYLAKRLKLAAAGEWRVEREAIVVPKPNHNPAQHIHTYKRGRPEASLDKTIASHKFHFFFGYGGA